MSATAYYASRLRHELIVRNHRFATKHQVAHACSYGGIGVVVYEPDPENLRHGNFADQSYSAIMKRAEWRKRLDKVHAQARRSLPKYDRGWKELDSCTSSDALLMNVFCYPDVAKSNRVGLLLGIETGQEPVFGLKARVPLKSGLSDRTEIDMRVGDLLVEAKLTESNFQTRSFEVVRGYRDFAKVFDAKLLPKAAGKFDAYQLIRNVLAAYANQCSFCVLLDARRPDLIENWYAVMRAVRREDLRVRCKVLTWQELSEVLPEHLREFLDFKYGIVPPGTAATPFLTL